METKCRKVIIFVSKKSKIKQKWRLMRQTSGYEKLNRVIITHLAGSLQMHAYA